MSNAMKLKRKPWGDAPIIRTAADRRRWEAAKAMFPLTLAQYDELLSQAQTPATRATLEADRRQLIEDMGGCIEYNPQNTTECR